MEQRKKKNPWLAMWIHPKATIAEIVAKNPRQRFLTLSFIYGVPWIFHVCQAFLLGKFYSLPLIMVVTLILAIPFGFVMLSFSSLIFYWTGKLIRGKSSYFSMRAAVSWANVPNVVNIFIWIISLFVLGKYTFNPTAVPAEWMSPMTSYLQIVMIIEGILSLWGLVILILAVSEVQKFSGWMAFLNAILAFLLSSIIIYALGWGLLMLVGN